MANQTKKTHPILAGDSKKAVEHRGSHLQIIASAGAGKTEVVSQRIVSLLAEGISGREIVAFTFTERAARELKDRVVERVEQIIGKDALDLISGLFIGTIHAYSFRFLQQQVPLYETYDVIDENQLTALLARESNRLNLKDLSPKNQMFDGISLFRRNADVVENELIDPVKLTDPFKSTYLSYLEMLQKYRLMSYGQQIAGAVRELENPAVQNQIHSTLKHLIVDEYQDVNPAQERLIQLLTGSNTQLCVVGDDDQAIYQWRGSSVGNIINFSHRYKNVKTFTISDNRRSRPLIVTTANEFATTIPNRLPKAMNPSRASSKDKPEVVLWTCEDEETEAGYIAQHILDLADRGVRYSDMAVLVRSSTSYTRILDQFALFDIPVQPAGRTGLFDQPEAEVLAKAFIWLTDGDWRKRYQPSEPIDFAPLLQQFTKTFGLSKAQTQELKTALNQLKKSVPNEKRISDLVGELYELLDILDIRNWDLGNALQSNRAGTIARFASLLADFEMVQRRARPDSNIPGEQVGGQDRGAWYYRSLARFISNYAVNEYDDYGGEDEHGLDAVDITTIHSAKGLEWPVVFIPSLTKKRFPSSRTGTAQTWLIPRKLFDASRYEGSDADERRLFYVAITRARDWVGISRHEKITTQKVGPSPYFEELANLDLEVDPDLVAPSPIETRPVSETSLKLSYSEIAAFNDCGYSYRLRNRIGFPVRFAAELGYGKAVHHVLRSIAEHTKSTGKVPDGRTIDKILDSSFFLPAANKVGHREMKNAAREIINIYVTKHKSDLFRIWETERPFELRLDGVAVSGRADVILDNEGGVETGLAILDYKTSTKADLADHDLQLQIYVDAGRREGLDVKTAYIHDLKLGTRSSVSLAKKELSAAEAIVVSTAEKIKKRQFAARPGKQCKSCEVRMVCSSAKR
jgi:DNA helicase-2/ATP-dependent DNA helicase PcrA